MAWGTVTVGGIAFRETMDAVDDGAGGLTIAGQEAHPGKLKAEVEAAYDNVSAMSGQVVPVTFTDKQWLTGFYRVESARAALFRFAQGAVQTATWQLTLRRIGTSRDVTIESTVPLVPRTDDIPGTQTPVYWHAPAIGATSYYTGPNLPGGPIMRPGEDGIVPVYTALPDDVIRWTIRADDYLRGGARIAFDGIRRTGLTTPPAAVWSVSNGLVRLTPGAGGTVVVQCYDNSIYRSAATWAFTVGGIPLGTQPELTIMANDPEEVRIRLTYPNAPGLVVVDLGLRRGSRFVTGVLKRHSVATLGIVETGSAAASAMTGGIRQATADADGNLFVAGSARNATIDAANAGLSLAGALRFDFFLGHEVDPGQAGDLYADLLAQYLGSSGEKVRVVRR